MNDIEKWAVQIRAGDSRALSRALSAIEDRSQNAEELLRILFPYTGKSYFIGVTGAPGTGKSTLVDRLAVLFRRKDRKVGVLAVDPSSPFTGGAILGDRVRMQSHFRDEEVFIRSMATRGSLGGLAAATSDAALLLDAAGKDVVLVETVGVGQGEVDIVRLADCTLVVLTPGMGDDVQNLKAGVMEIADVFVLNKSDQAGADRYEQQLKAILALVPERDGWKPPVVRTIATEGRGVDELGSAMESYRVHVERSTNREARETRLWKERLVHLLGQRFLDSVAHSPGAAERLEEAARRVASRASDPYSAVEALLQESGWRSNP